MKKLIRNSTAEFLIFTSQAGEDSIEVRFENENIWLSQKMLAQLFGCSPSTINEHLKNIFNEDELVKDNVMRKFGNSEFSTKPTNFYSLDAIISVGYRVNSVRATQFRQWATAVLKEFSIKGFVLDNKRLESGTFLGKDNFEALLADIRGQIFEKCARENAVFIKKLRIFMPPVLITIKALKPVKTPFLKCKITK